MRRLSAGTMGMQEVGDVVIWDAEAEGEPKTGDADAGLGGDSRVWH